MTTSELPIAGFLSMLAARTPAPGGGAAAAVAAALGCATGAMAARYTTGPKWADREADAAALGDRLDALAQRLALSADADAAAFSAVQAARKAKDPAAIASAEATALAVPAALISDCANAAHDLAAFRPHCNPHLVSDVDAGIALLAGAARAAFATLLINQPPETVRAVAAAQLASLP
jgi:formiminotetrahydrofolate cyclodeaminase